MYKATKTKKLLKNYVLLTGSEEWYNKKSDLKMVNTLLPLVFLLYQ